MAVATRAASLCVLVTLSFSVHNRHPHDVLLFQPHPISQAEISCRSCRQWKPNESWLFSAVKSLLWENGYYLCMSSKIVGDRDSCWIQEYWTTEPWGAKWFCESKRLTKTGFITIAKNTTTLKWYSRKWKGTGTKIETAYEKSPPSEPRQVYLSTSSTFRSTELDWNEPRDDPERTVQLLVDPSLRRFVGDESFPSRPERNPSFDRLSSFVDRLPSFERLKRRSSSSKKRRSSSSVMVNFCREIKTPWMSNQHHQMHPPDGMLRFACHPNPLDGVRAIRWHVEEESPTEGGTYPQVGSFRLQYDCVYRKLAINKYQTAKSCASEESGICRTVWWNKNQVSHMQDTEVFS
jgi:hypothetical protein